MFFGGLNGLNAFFPEKMKKNSYTPDMILNTSGSLRWVVIRDCPGRRRSSSRWINSSSIDIPAGHPSMTTPTPVPCDSPNDVTLKIWPNVFCIELMEIIWLFEKESMAKGKWLSAMHRFSFLKNNPNNLGCPARGTRPGTKIMVKIFDTDALFALGYAPWRAWGIERWLLLNSRERPIHTIFGSAVSRKRPKSHILDLKFCDLY